MIDNFAALAVSQIEADESLTRMLGRLETVGVVARVEPSTDALLGFERRLRNTLAAISKHVLACCADSSGTGLWPISSQQRSRVCNVFVWTTT